MSPERPPGATVPDTSLLTSLVQRGKATADHVREIVEAVRLEHQAAAPAAADSRWGSPALLRLTIEESCATAQPQVPELVAPSLLNTTRCALLGVVTFREDLLRRRLDEGRVRAGRGGIRGEHVAFLPRCTLVGGDEDEAFRCSDPVADLAALRVDLELLEARKLATELVETYRAQADDDPGPLVELYASLQALRRGNAMAARLRRQHASPRQLERWSELARRLYGLAYFHALFLARPILILVAGPRAPERTAVARQLARTLGAPLYRSDEVRNELAGVPASENETAVLGPEHYTPRFNELTYEELAERARRQLVKGATVILEAGFSRQPPLWATERMADQSGAAVLRLRCRPPEPPPAAGDLAATPPAPGWHWLRTDRPTEAAWLETLELLRALGPPAWRVADR